MEQVVHRRHRVKLKKDLTGLNPKMRQALLDISEIEDVSKIYNSMKKRLGMADRKIDITHSANKEEETRKVMEVSIEQRVFLKKQQRNQEKLNEKMKQFLSRKEKRSMQVYRTPMRKYISLIESTGKEDRPSTYLQDLKLSQQELVYVKNNASRRRSCTASMPQRFSRSRVISMETGLPLTQKYCFHPFDDFLNDAIPKQQTKKIQSVDELEKELDEVIDTDNRNRQKSTPNEIHKGMSTSITIDNQNSRRAGMVQRVKTSLDNSFKASQDMMMTFTRYASTKERKKSAYKELVETWKVDRPFTNQLRRKNYQIVGQQNLKKIDVYRKVAEKQRQSILGQNKKFYNELMSFILKQAKYAKNLDKTRHLVEGLRRGFELFNKFDQHDLDYLLDEAKQQSLPEDQVSQEVLRRIQRFLQTQPQEENK